jgi:splicing factor, arginine/serine-rich 17
LQVSKSSIEFLKFDAEVDDRKILKNIIAKLDNRKVRIAGFTEYASVRAVETKGDFPSRHDWDSFFRDAKNMDEMKPGERPDTVFLSGMPIKWFRPRHQENDETIKPSENLFKRIFEKYGTVRCVDIPICDVYRDKMKSSLTGLKHFSFDNDTYFEG